MRFVMDGTPARQRANTALDPAASGLPFAGLGLDLAKVRRKVSGLVLRVFPRQHPPLIPPCREIPPLPSGYGLLVRLSRETRGR